MTDLIFIDAKTVRKNLTMDLCMRAMRDAMAAVSDGKVTIPPRTFMSLPYRSGFLGLMPASAAAAPVYGVKVISLHEGNPAHGRPAIQGFIALFDHETGSPIAIIDGASVTAIRTAAASGLATQLLAREDVKSHGVMGTGVQAATHTEAILAARPNIEKTLIWGRNLDKAAKLAAALAKKTGKAVMPASSQDEAAGCDIISTVTASKEPILHYDSLREGVHINLVGSHTPEAREADTKTVQCGEVYVDTIEGALKEAGDLLIPIAEGVFHQNEIIGEIGAVAAGRLPGRKSDQKITIFKSLGVAAQDLYAAWALLERIKNID